MFNIMSFIDILKTLDKLDTYLHYLDCFKNCLKLLKNPIFYPRIFAT